MRTPSLLGLALLSSALLVGCGGGGSSSGPTNDGIVSVTGGATMLTKSVTTGVPSSGTPINHDFGGTSAVIPSGVTIPDNSAVAILTASTPLFNAQGTGNLSVNGSETGLSLANGSISANLALPPHTLAPYTVVATAPAGGFLIPTNRSRGFDGLTVNTKLQLNTPVLANGTAGFPTSLSGSIPKNGSTTGNVTLDVFFPAAFAGYRATLSVTWTANGQPFTIAQTKTVAASGVVNFSARTNYHIPTTGVDTISLSLAPAN